jgi:hypothetical protein
MLHIVTNSHHDNYRSATIMLALVTHAEDFDGHIVDHKLRQYFLMLERDLQRESCSRSNMVMVNRLIG